MKRNTMKNIIFAIMAVLMLYGCAENKPLTFVAGSYETTYNGHNGPITIKTTFSDSTITKIEVISQDETPHIGDCAFEQLIPQIISANGIGMDAISGATVTSHALMNAVAQAAENAQVSDIDQFRKNNLEGKTQDIDDTWDVVIVGAGGAGMAAAAEAAAEGNTVLVLEKNGEMGGNTLVSGGIYQSVVPYLVWEPSQPDATMGKGYDGQMYEKAKMGTGGIEELQLIMDWSEEDFDSIYYTTHDFTPGKIEELSKRGVHREYRPILQALKKEISTYLAWAKPKLQRGMPETNLTLFSTNNLHIFQTYYGGLRQSAEGNKWAYGDMELVKQMVEEGTALKPWLLSMGVEFLEKQLMISGEMWFRGNKMTGACIDTNGDGEYEQYDGNWGAYVMAPYHAFTKANPKNQVMTSTTAYELIMDGDRVTGVKAQRQDGSKVTVHATKGVIIASGGYAANVSKVINTNLYWKPEYLSNRMGTTNRSSQQGDGIEMAQDIGAAVTDMGWTQLMPQASVEYGNIAFGSISDAIFVNPETGKRFVDESQERDVLCIKAFKTGVTINGKSGAFLYIGGETTTEPNDIRGVDIPGKQYARTVDQLPALLKDLKLHALSDPIIKTIRAYDAAIMDGKEPDDIGKKFATSLIGRAKKNEDGTYDKSTYTLDSVVLTIRVMAPSAHHTMGGLRVDTWRRVLDNSGVPIPGLFAAGEVTGGIHGGNRLGGNALTEVMVSGRIAARSVNRQR